jgi:ribose transport system substrate-binding protein
MTQHRNRAVVALCALGLVAAACGSSGKGATGNASSTAAATATTAAAAAATTAAASAATTAAGAAATTAAASGGTATLKDGQFGEKYTPDPTILAKGLGGAGSLPTEERAMNVALATITRASIAVDQTLALKCWKENGCDTGTGGKLKVALADGQGGNIARQIFKMEFIRQSLTDPQIGHIAYTDANLDTQKAISDVRSFAAQKYDVILSYPDAGEAMVPAYKAAADQGAKVVLWSGGKVGTPGSDYLTYSGSDQCALAHAWGVQFGKSLPDGGKIAIVTGAPGNPTDPLEEKCLKETLPANIQIVAKQGTAWSRDAYLQATSAILAQFPDIKGIVGAYGDAFVGSIRAFQAANVSMKGLVTMHQSDDNPFLCAWKDAGGITDSYTYVALLLEGRAGMTAAMMKIAGYDVPPQIIFGVQLKKVTNDSCRTDIPPDGSPSSLVPPELQKLMFPG